MRTFLFESSKSVASRKCHTVGQVSLYFFTIFKRNFSSIAASSVARGLSVYLDALIDNKMSTFFHELFPMNVSFLAPYPDFFSFTMVLLLATLLAFGVKESTILNNILTLINLATVILVIVSGIIKGKTVVTLSDTMENHSLLEIVCSSFRICLSIFK